jgi:uncharacterized protein YqeY
VSFQDRLGQDMKEALKAKDKDRLSVIRMVRAEVKQAEIDKRDSLTDDEVFDVILREVKKRKDAIAEYTKAGREELAKKEQQELAILEQYLPQPLTEEELRAIVAETVQSLNVSSKKEMGKAIQAVMSQVKGRAEGKTVARLVQEALPS